MARIRSKRHTANISSTAAARDTHSPCQAKAPHSSGLPAPLAWLTKVLTAFTTPMKKV